MQGKGCIVRKHNVQTEINVKDTIVLCKIEQIIPNVLANLSTNIMIPKSLAIITLLFVRL